MKYLRNIAVLAAVPALVLAVTAVRAHDVASWNGTWTGSVGKKLVWPVSISISQGKVVGYVIKGVAFPIRYSEVTPAKISFGDNDNYAVELQKTGDRTATGEARGRKGEGPVAISKE